MLPGLYTLWESPDIKVFWKIWRVRLAHFLDTVETPVFTHSSSHQSTINIIIPHPVSGKASCSIWSHLSFWDHAIWIYALHTRGTLFIASFKGFYQLPWPSVHHSGLQPLVDTKKLNKIKWLGQWKMPFFSSYL